MRVDVWLWAARFFRTRNLARQAIDNGKVDVGGQRAKPARVVHVGDVLRLVRGEDTYEIEIRGISGNRGPPAIAQGLYSESEVSRLQRETGHAARAAARAGYRAPDTKPDKRARRLIRALGDIDAL